MEGKLPSTQEVTKQLETAKMVLEEEAKKKGVFAPERKLAKDAAEFVETTKEFIEEKNRGEIFQQIVKDAAAASDELSNMFANNTFFADRYKMVSMQVQLRSDTRKLAQLRLDSLKNLSLTLVNSSEFRTLLTDIIDLIQTIYKTEMQQAPSLNINQPVQYPGETIPISQQVQPTFGQTSKELPTIAQQVVQKGQEAASFGTKLAKDFKEGFPMAEDKKLEIKFRFNQILKKINNDPNYRSAVDGIFTILDQLNFYFLQFKEVGEPLKEQTKTLWYSEDSALNKLAKDLKIFISNFTGVEPLDILSNDFSNFSQLVMNDDRLSNFFWDLRQYILDVINNPDLLDTDDMKFMWNDLFERSRFLLNDPKYNDLWNRIWVGLQICLENIKNDPIQLKLAADSKKIVSDLFLDMTGKPSLPVIASGVVKVKNLLMPIIQKNLENVPVPAMSGTSEKYDWKIDGLLLNIKSILPENIEIKVWGKALVGLKEDVPSKAITYMTMWIRDFHFEAKNLKFWFNRKVTPKLEERGIADVVLKGKNELRITWKIQGEETDKAWIYGIEKVDCNLDDLDITIKESTHTWLMKLITSLFSGSIRRSIEDSIEKGIVEGMGNLSQTVYEGYENFGEALTDTLKGRLF
jgi:hypothetical protein